MTTLFQQLGGHAAVDLAVDRFYERVLADPRIARFFSGVDMRRQRARQKAFLAYAFGGLPSYDGQDMRRAHAHLLVLGLDDSHVDAVIENLAATLRDLGVAEPLVAQVTAIAESTRDDVLSR